MKIAIAHFRAGKTDGVSLEMNKWKTVLEEMGHDVYFISGSKNESEIYISELYYRHPVNNKFVENAYRKLKDYNKEKEFEKDIEEFADRIERKLTEGIEKYQIDLLIPNNIFSLGWGLPAALAFYRVIEKMSIPTIAHHHDFYWERARYDQSQCEFVKDILREYFPPESKLINHVVINNIAGQQLKKRKGLSSTVIPNVFDFNRPSWKVDSYNNDLRAKLGIKPSDLVILQATRVAERKAIELAIEFTGRLQKQKNKLKGKLYDGRQFNEDNNIVFLLPGLIEAEKSYVDFLCREADKFSVKLIWANEGIGDRRRKKEDEKIYSLWDTYAISDLITYPSILEGWGNQLLEGLFARKPMIIYEYPVYLTDIKDKGLKLASLGSGYRKRENGYIRIEQERFTPALKEAVRYLKDSDYREKVVDHNFKIGRDNYSYQNLKKYIKKCLSVMELR